MIPEPYAEVQRSTFDALVRDGTYGEGFAHADWARRFFAECMSEALDRLGGGTLRVLECGCGPGAWLEVMAALLDGRAPAARAELFGFDVTPAMIEVARRRLASRVPADRLQVGDVLDARSYQFGGPGRRFDLIFAYDVIQQLPRRRQVAACRTMAGQLRPGGVLLVFDHDRQTRFGRVMGFKKFVTRYTGIELVPPYFCNARYPALRRMGVRLARGGRCRVDLRIAPGGHKRALIVSPGSGPATGEAGG